MSIASGQRAFYTRHFWAKAHPYRQRGPERIHLLEHHLADVGACFEALLMQPTIRRRMARAGGGTTWTMRQRRGWRCLPACTTSARSTLAFKPASGRTLICRRASGVR